MGDPFPISSIAGPLGVLFVKIISKANGNQQNPLWELMEYAQKTGIEMCMLAVDAEKAFDRIGWRFLEETLSLVCGPPAVSTRARSIFPSPSHWRGLCYSPLVEAVHEVSWPYLQPPEPPDQSK